MLVKVKDKIVDIIAVICLWFVMKWDEILDLIKSVVITFVICLIVFTFFIKPASVSGRSMHPTIYDESFGFSSIITKQVKGISRFDIVTVRVSGKKLIKRVVGLPNELIELKDEQLYVNGELISQPFLDTEYVKEQLNENGYFTKDFTIQLGENEYFLLGDNRIISADSRVYGSFKYEDILSVGLFVFYPFNNFGVAK